MSEYEQIFKGFSDEGLEFETEHFKRMRARYQIKLKELLNEQSAGVGPDREQRLGLDIEESRNSIAIFNEARSAAEAELAKRGLLNRAAESDEQDSVPEPDASSNLSDDEQTTHSKSRSRLSIKLPGIHFSRRSVTTISQSSRRKATEPTRRLLNRELPEFVTEFGPVADSSGAGLPRRLFGWTFSALMSPIARVIYRVASLFGVSITIYEAIYRAVLRWRGG